MLLSITTSALAQDSTPVQFPGVASSLEEIINIHRNQYESLLEKVGKNPKLMSQLGNISDVKLNKYFMRSILFHSEFRYLDLAEGNECTFYALIENDLVKTTTGNIDNIIITFNNKENKRETALVMKKDFLKYVYKKKCFQNGEISTLFKLENLSRTIKALKFQTPKNKNQCVGILKEWQDNSYTPYLCRIPEIMNEAKKSRLRLNSIPANEVLKRRYYRQKISLAEVISGKVGFFERSYLENLCQSIADQGTFCSTYLASDVWNKITNGEEPRHKMEYKCSIYLKKQMPLSLTQLRRCAAVFNKTPDACINLGSKKFPSIFPRNKCDAISEALAVSNLKTNYQDCPAEVDNEGIVNIHRILNHLKPREVLSTSSSCANETNFSFAKLNIDYKNADAWPLKICFKDRIQDKEVCERYIPGYNPTSKLSEGNVISKILYRIKGTQSNMKCKSVKKQNYNPNLLEHKVGCWIVYDDDICTTLHCPKRIFVDQKQITDLKFVGKPVFEYFANSFSNEKFSLMNIINETYKIEPKKVRNLTELKYFFDNNKNGIIHGIGCVEDLYPARFHKNAFNECSPLPFIIDGYRKAYGNTFLTLRTAIDDIHSPRPLVWNYLFNSVAGYRELHPLKLWTLYAIRN
ncbi:MAG: hypothetical protein KC493_02215 [Bacteriovoracaceae bacterium]|nr:hypothetical protein [Bacteriovoracaceae bacterium]